MFEGVKGWIQETDKGSRGKLNMAQLVGDLLICLIYMETHLWFRRSIGHTLERNGLGVWRR